jgi:hypothetical protein
MAIRLASTGNESLGSALCPYRRNLLLAHQTARHLAFQATDLPGDWNWIRSLGPYPTLALFAVPLIVLEPVKPVGLYLIASGNVIDGTVLIGVGEIAKITIVERIFHAGRDKLMTIPAFAWSYERVMSLRAYLETLAVWQAMLKAVRAIKETARRILAFAKNSLTSLRRAD